MSQRGGLVVLDYVRHAGNLKLDFISSNFDDIKTGLKPINTSKNAPKLTWVYNSTMKKLWIIIVSIIIVIALGLGAWAIWQQNQPVPDTTKNNDTNQPSTNKTDDKATTVSKPLTIYYIAIEDNGIAGSMIGCGDSLVARDTAPITTTDLVKSSFQQLLAGKDQFIGQSGLYNALYQSNLTYLDSSVAGDTVTVNLTGTLKLAGECDNPRVQAQLEQTAKTAAGVAKATINLNNKPLAESLSLK